MPARSLSRHSSLDLEGWAHEFPVAHEAEEIVNPDWDGRMRSQARSGETRTYGNTLAEQRKLDVVCTCGHTKGQHSLVQQRRGEAPRFMGCLAEKCTCPMFRVKVPGS